MIRATLTKIRRICSLRFVSHIPPTDVLLTRTKFAKLSTGGQCNQKSTQSGHEDEDKCEKCKLIIERIFAPNKPEDTTVNDGSTEVQEMKRDQLAQMITPQVHVPNENLCENCRKIIAKALAENQKLNNQQGMQYAPDTRLQSTTFKEEDEKLKQKIEIIDETPLVEAAKPKVEGFNTSPKVLGNEDSTVLKYSEDNQPANTQDALDELAKRCLNAPSSQIDDRILKEMEKLGIPQTTHRESNANLIDKEYVQIDVLKKPRKPVQKSEVELETRVLEREQLNSTRIEQDFDKEGRLIYPLQQSNFKEDYCNCVTKELDNSNQKVDTISNHLKSLKYKEKSKEKRVKVSNEIVPQQLMVDYQREAVVFTQSTEEYSDLLRNSKPHEKIKENHEAVKKLKHSTSPQVDQPIITESQPAQVFRNTETVPEETSDVPMQVERLKPHHLDDEPSIASKEFSPHTKQAVIIKGYPVPETKTNDDLKTESLLAKRKRILSKNLLRDLSVVSKPATKPQPVEDVQESYNPTFIPNLDIKPERLQPHYLQEDITITSRDYTPNDEPSILIKEYLQPGNKNTEQSNELYSQMNPNSISKKRISKNKPSPIKETSDRDCMTPILEQNQVLIDPYNKNSIDMDTESYCYDPLINKKKDKEIEQPIVPNVNNLNDTVLHATPTNETREIPENEFWEPVICSETGRFKEIEKNKHVEKYLHQKKDIKSEGIIGQLLDKGTLHANKNEDKVESMPKVDIKKQQISLQELLQTIRQRKRLELYREFLLQVKALEVDPLVGKCGEPKKQCPPPPPECPPKNPCQPRAPCPAPKRRRQKKTPKSPCPDPCSPPPQKKEKKQKPPICPPVRKDPCNKFKRRRLTQIRDTLTVLLTTLGPQINLPQCNMTPTINNVCTSKSLVTEDIVMKLNALGNFLRAAYFQGQVHPFSKRVALSNNNLDTVIFARDYKPWVPIPSWPLQEKEKKQRFVCPKEGCRQSPPPPLSQPCNENPCKKLPKHSFSLIDILFSKKIFYVRDI